MKNNPIAEHLEQCLVFEPKVFSSLLCHRSFSSTNKNIQEKIIVMILFPGKLIKKLPLTNVKVFKMEKLT